jgi:hypothetical protein
MSVAGEPERQNVQFTNGTSAYLTYKEAMYRVINGYEVKPGELDKFSEHQPPDKTYMNKPRTSDTHNEHNQNTSSCSCTLI